MQEANSTLQEGECVWFVYKLGISIEIQIYYHLFLSLKVGDLGRCF